LQRLLLSLNNCPFSPRRPVIDAHAAGQPGIKKAGSSNQFLMTRLEVLHMIERFTPLTAEGAGTGG